MYSYASRVFALLFALLASSSVRPRPEPPLVQLWPYDVLSFVVAHASVAIVGCLSRYSTRTRTSIN